VAATDELTGGYIREARSGEQPTYNEVAAAYRPLTDQGNGERLAKRAKGKLLYTSGTGWLVWDGARWLAADLEEEREEAKLMARSIHTEAAELNQGAASHSDDDTRRQLGALAEETGKWARKSEATPRADAAIKQARSDRRLRVRVSDLDAKPDVLNVQNGTLDLKSLELCKHDPTQRLTKIAGAAFEPGAPAPFWEATLKRILPDEDVRRYVQMAAGYSMLGSYSEYLFVPYGQGSNGKSTLLWGLRHVLGDYAHEAPSDLLVRRKERSAGDDSALAQLRGRRLVTTMETDQGSRLAEVQVKQLTGEQQISAKLMRQDRFTYENQAAVWMGTNHRPYVQGMDEAMWRRIRLIPFDQFIPESERLEQDVVQARLGAEASGILNWVVEGLRMNRQERGVKNAPDAVRVATSAYREEMDPLGTWLDDCCEFDPDAFTPNGDLTGSYRDYCLRANREPLGERRFFESLEQRGVTKVEERKTINGKRVRKGLRIVRQTS